MGPQLSARAPHRVEVLALDLEGTLISNAMSQIARPGLASFLEFCGQAFPRVVAYTFLREDRFRQIARMLIDEGSAPGWFDALEYIPWDGKVKDLRNIPDADPDRCLLVDDYEPYVHPDQRSQWIAIAAFEAPYSDDDRELERVRKALEKLAPELPAPADDGLDKPRTPGRRQQASAIPYRETDKGTEVLLVTSARSKKWILPKGYVDPGSTPTETAVNEAREEAGVIGTVSPTRLCTYEYEKRSTHFWVQVFPLRVDRVLDDWEESRFRDRRWVTLDEAGNLVESPTLQAVLSRFKKGTP